MWEKIAAVFIIIIFLFAIVSSELLSGWSNALLIIACVGIIAGIVYSFFKR
jgi:1,4-dihydroxy-2-naphthoate octaprenyltransferase